MVRTSIMVDEVGARDTHSMKADIQGSASSIMPLQAQFERHVYA